MPSRKFSRYFEIALVTLLMATYLYAALSEAHNFATEWFIRDDAFYYFKVAQNITEGHGITFDGINPTNGYHPLWMLVCIPIFTLARFDLILPLRILVLVSGAISAATGVLLYRLVGRALSLPAAILAASYWCFDRIIHSTVTMFGLETGLTALTMTALLLAMSNLEPDYRHKPLTSRQLWTLGLLAVAMVFSRLDTVFLAALAGAWILLRGTPIRYYVMFDIAIIVFAAFTSVVIRTGLPEYFVYTKSAVALAALGLLIQIPAFYIFGLYHLSAVPVIASRSSAKQSPTREEIASAGERRLAMTVSIRFILVTLASAAVVAGGLIGLGMTGQLEGLPRSALPLYAGLVLVGAGLVRLAAWRVTGSHPAPELFAEFREGWRQWLSEGIHFYGILGVALATYLAFNKIMFGTFTPVSGQIKRWWGSLQGSTYGNPVSTLSGFLGLEQEEGLNMWGPVVYRLHTIKDWLGKDGSIWLALGLVTVVVLAILVTQPKRSARAGIFFALPVLLCASILQMFYYVGLGYAGAKDWYWVSQMLMFTLLGALLVDLITRPLRLLLPSPRMGRGAGGEGKLGRAAVWAVTAACVAWLVIPFEINLVQRMPYRTVSSDAPYMDVLPFLEANTEPGALIGMTGGGNIGYFIEGRTIVNMDGLINSYAYYVALRQGRAGEYLANMGLDYIFSNPDILLNPPYNGQFGKWSVLVAQFGRKDLLKYSP
jgi:hypothetical protein